jgi:hypothetical protein
VTQDAKVQIGLSSDFLEGTKVTTPAGADLFREGVVISDPEIPGARAEVRQMGTQLTTGDWGLVTHSVIQGFSTSQGGQYHDVKVTPSGALTVEATVTGVVSVTGTVQIAEPVTVDGTVALDAATLAALESVNATVSGSVSVNNFPVTQQVSGTVEITNDVGNPIPVSGSVAVTDGGGSLTVDGSVSVNNFPTTQAVSGTVALDSATLAALETINVGNFPATQTVSATDLDIRNLSSTQDNVRAFDSTDSEYLRVATSVTATGDTTLVTPAAGKRIRLQWVYAINDPVASTSTKITVKLGTAVQYVAWAISKRQQLTGEVDAPLIVNLSNLGDVAVTVFYQEV